LYDYSTAVNELIVSGATKGCSIFTFNSTQKVSSIAALLCLLAGGEVAHSKEFSAKIHPILRIEQYGHFEASEISDADAKKLCHTLKRSNAIIPWTAAFDAGECEAGALTCKKLIGKSEKDVLAILGTPASHSIYPETEQSHSWLYVFGYTPILLRVEFVQEICSSANYYQFYDDVFYCDWRVKSLMETSVGKTVDAVIEREGWPYDEGRQTDFSKENYQKTINDLLKRKKELSVLKYRIYNWMITLSLNNCRVMGVEKGFVHGPKLLGQSRKLRFAGLCFRYPD